MPMSRYEIRNEYSLADPELYRAADKDDPEALLEGVAMAGLVGVLRQLGDLAEFAAEVFHDLHEEVMATASRGHGLMIRVQQLESEVPFIEKAFLSQTDHSPYFYNAGVDWHSNLRLEQNLVTQGDLPRFIMDSYEECRGPPRLFLLDKFDVAGAGACLKRYTDPSFFKVETSGMSRADVHREKFRKAKKRGPRWRNGENPEVLSASHAKLHQLFMEERVGNVVDNPARRVKLKRRLNGFTFDSVTGRGYMEKLLKTPSPEHQVLHEVNVSSSPLMLPTNDYDESRLEVPEVRRADTDIEGVERKGSVSSPGREESMSTYESNETSKYDVTCEAQSSYHGMVTDDISSTSESLTSEKNIASDGAHKTEGSLTGYQSDEIASEIDNYVDAPSTMESEMDTDSELKVKSDFTFSFIRSQPLISDAKEDSNPTRSSDSQSTGESIISDDGNNSLKKGTSGFSSSDSPSTSAEDPHSETNLEKGLASADIHEIDIVDTSTHQTITDVELFADPQSLSLVPDYTCTSTDAFSNRRSGFEQLPSGLGITDAQGTLTLSSPGVVERDWMERPQLNEAASVSDDEERKTEMFTDPLYSHSNSGFTSQWGEGSQRSVAEEHARQNGENIPLLYTTAGNSYHADSSTGISAGLLHEGECNPEDLNPVENIASTLNNTGTPEMIPLENPILCNIDEEVLEFPENVSYDCPDVDQGGDNFKSASWEVEKQSEASLAGSHIVGAEEDYSNGSISNQISSETSILPHVEKPLYWTETVLDSHGRNVVPEEDSIVNATPTFGTLKYSEVVGSQAPEMTDELNLYESAALESSRGSPENLEEPAGPSDSVAYEKITTDTSSTEAEVDETMGPADAKLQNEIHVKLDEFDADQVETLDMVSTTAALSDNANRSDLCLPVNPDKCLAEHTPCPEDAGMGELGDSANYLSETQKKPSLVEEVNENKAILSEPNRHLNLEESDIVRDLNLPSDADHGLELVDSTSIQPAMEQSSFDTEQETLQKSGFVNHVSSDSSLPMFANTKDLTFQEEIELPSNQHDEEFQGAGEQETLQKRGFLSHVSSDSSLPMFANTKDLTFQEEIELPSNQHDEEFLGAREINPGLSNLLPINHQQTLDHDDHNGDNDSALPFSLFNHASPPFPLELPGLYNDKSDFSGRTKVPVHSIFPHHKFSETSQPNQDELPPLPPLPPVQWRMGKLQHASSISERETMKQELFPLINSSSTTSTDALSPATEEMNHSLVQMAPETSSNDKKVEHSMSNLEAGAAHEMTDPQQETENEPRQMSTPTNEGLVLDETNHSQIQIDHETATKEEDCSSSVEASAMNETIDLRAKSENEQQQPMAPSTESSSFEEMNFSLVQTNPEDASERENIQQHSSSLEAGPMSDKVDVPVKIENEQQKPVVSFSVSESKLSADEDGVPNSKTKPPRTRDPLIDEVAAIDKSRLKRVTDRVLPEIQKVDERDSLLQQIRTKSFNLKPAVASRPSIRGPNTNLRVAAILEKANAIRQALAGSDEDDDDNWSDS